MIFTTLRCTHATQKELNRGTEAETIETNRFTAACMIRFNNVINKYHIASEPTISMVQTYKQTWLSAKHNEATVSKINIHSENYLNKLLLHSVEKCHYNSHV
jgi:uncharacterized protein YjdB